MASCCFEVPVKVPDITPGSAGVDFNAKQETKDGLKVHMTGTDPSIIE